MHICKLHWLEIECFLFSFSFLFNILKFISAVVCFYFCLFPYFWLSLFLYFYCFNEIYLFCYFHSFKISLISIMRKDFKQKGRKDLLSASTTKHHTRLVRGSFHHTSKTTTQPGYHVLAREERGQTV